MEKLDKEKKTLVEKIGVVYEEAGHTPMAGRVVGLLLLAEPPYLPFDSIANELKASKSSISNTLKLLMSIGLVEYITLTGDRKRYFKINVDAIESILYKETENLKKYNQLLKNVQNIRSNKYPEFNQSLKRFIRFFELVELEYPKMIQRWKAQTK